MAFSLLWFVPAAFGDVVVTSKQSDCKTDSDIREDEIVVEVTGCTLHIFHRNVVINCCLEYSPRVEVEGYSIEVTEVDTGPPCDCICPFDLEVTIDGLEPGMYTLVLNAFLHPEPLSYTVEIPPCDEFWILGAEVWSPMGIEGVVVPAYATNPRPLQGFSFGTTYPLEHALMAEINLDGTVTEEVGAEFLHVEIDNGREEPVALAQGWATCAVILDWEPPFEGQTIPPGSAQHIVNLVYDILPPGEIVPRSISVPFEDGLGKPPVALVFTVDGRDVVPQVQNGIIQIMWPPEFIRGDANDNGLMTISDSIYLLDFLFRGGPVPPCEDSADANDDGALDISDAVTILGYLFSGGSIPPPSPPGPPGPDPTMDELGCERENRPAD
jgi:hypothetical protein